MQSTGTRRSKRSSASSRGSTRVNMPSRRAGRLPRSRICTTEAAGAGIFLAQPSSPRRDLPPDIPTHEPRALSEAGSGFRPTSKNTSLRSGKRRTAVGPEGRRRIAAALWHWRGWGGRIFPDRVQAGSGRSSRTSEDRYRAARSMYICLPRSMTSRYFWVISPFSAAGAPA